MPRVPGRFGTLGHFVVYAVLGALVFAANRRGGAVRAAAIAIAVASVYGVTDEFHQAFVPGRTPDPLDWAVDTLGSAAAVALIMTTARMKAALRRPS